MNVLIVGNSDINKLLKQGLRDEGISSDTISDCSGLVRLQGRPGAYELTVSGEKYTGLGVIVTEQPYTDKSELFAAKALNLLLPGTVEKLLALNGRKTIAILLDYNEETPEWLTVRAYEAAVRLANAKNDVVFLSMFAKAASTGIEKLYLKARQAGVTFIKYERAGAEFEEDTDVFTVTVNDGVFDTVIETPYLITVGIRDDAVLAFLGGKFRVADKKEIVSEFKYFLNPALTTRKGVYHIHKDLGVALPYIINDLRQIEIDGSGGDDESGGATGGSGGVHAEIDSGKCAFCYSCYRACPHAALEPDIQAGAMVCTENACMACGVCVAICPGEAIVLTEQFDLSAVAGGLNPSAGDLRVDCFGTSFLAMTAGENTEAVSEDGGAAADDMDVTEENGNAGMCKVYCCENSAGPAFAELTEEFGDDATKLCLSEIPCGGRLGHELITDALASYDKVLVAVCIDGACRHMNGGKRACKQAERVIGEIEKSGLDGKKVKCVQVSHAMPKVLIENVKALLDDAKPDDK